MKQPYSHDRETDFFQHTHTLLRLSLVHFFYSLAFVVLWAAFILNTIYIARSSFQHPFLVAILTIHTLKCRVYDDMWSSIWQKKEKLLICSCYHQCWCCILFLLVFILNTHLFIGHIVWKQRQKPHKTRCCYSTWKMKFLLAFLMIFFFEEKKLIFIDKLLLIILPFETEMHFFSWVILIKSASFL